MSVKRSWLSVSSKYSSLAIVFFVIVLSLGVIGSEAGTSSTSSEGRKRNKNIIVNASGGADHTLIQRGLDNAIEGDTVYVEAGVYRENLTITVGGIELVGEDNSTTIIEAGDNETCFVVEGSGISITGFNISGGKKNVVNTSSKNNLISKNVFYNNGLILKDSANNDILSNRFMNSRLDIVDSERDRVENNYMGTDGETNIVLGGSLNTSLRNNRLAGGDIKFTYFYGQYQGPQQGQGQQWRRPVYLEEEGWSHTIEKNSLDGKPMYYYAFQSGFSVPKNAVWAVITRCSDFEIVDVDNLEALYISDSEGGRIRESTIDDSPSPLYQSGLNEVVIYNSIDLRISDCSFIGNVLGLWQTTNSTIDNNTMRNSSVILRGSINITIYKNRFFGGSIGFMYSGQGPQGPQGQQGQWGDGLFIDNELWSHNIEGNLIDGRPFYYFSYKNNFTVPSDGYQVIITKCSDFIVEGLTETEYIHVSYSKNGTIRDCQFGAGYGGVRIDRSKAIDIYHNTFIESERNIYVLHNSELNISHNTIENSPYTGMMMIQNLDSDVTFNIITNCGGYGIYIYSDDGTQLKNNLCLNNSLSGIYLSDANQGWEYRATLIKNNNCSGNNIGIEVVYHWVDIKNLFIEQNVCNSNNLDGIRLSNYQTLLNRNTCNYNGKDGIAISPWYGSRNTLTNNTFISNHNYGLNISERCNRNLIHHNNLIGNNRGGIQAFDNGSENDWNHSGKGNYWSDYPSRYPETGNDGEVWDGPYEIEGSEDPQDRHPLFKPLNIDHIAPVAFSGRDTTVKQHRTVRFDAAGSFGFSPITNYTWSFEYNSETVLLYGARSTFVFRKIGTYEVTLRVSNERNEEDEDTIYITVVDGERPRADAGEDRSVFQGVVVTFNASSSTDNVGIANYSWHFSQDGDNVTLYGVSPAFRFNVPGVHDITLNVSDAIGNYDTDKLNLTVKKRGHTSANAGEDITVNQHETVIFNGTGSRSDLGILNFTWSFRYGDRTMVLHGPEPEFVFHDAGNYTVELKVTDPEGDWDTGLLVVTVLDITPPTAAAGRDIFMEQHRRANFSAINSSDNVRIVNYTWSFIYNNTERDLYGASASFTFDIPGVYNVTLKVRDVRGNAGSDNLTVTVNRTLDREKETGNVSEADSDPVESNDITEMDPERWKPEGSGESKEVWRWVAWAGVSLMIVAAAVVVLLVYGKREEEAMEEADECDRVRKD